MNIPGLILAGGEARRLAGKPMRVLAGRPLLAHVIARAAPQVRPLWLSVRRGESEFGGFGLEAVEDAQAESLGPLAGVAAGLRRAMAEGMDQLATFPCDAQFFPLDLVARLSGSIGEAAAAVPAYRGAVHPTFGLWTKAAAPAVKTALAGGSLRLHDLLARLSAAIVPFDELPADPFVNINTEADLLSAARRLRDGCG